MKISVMVITYNHEQFIAQAIQSVLDQRVSFDYEIVIGEDCSTDRTRDIVMDFHRRYPDRIVPLFRDRNLGGARNVVDTLAACRGEYLALLEGDDYWTSKDKLQKQVDFLDENPEFAMCCSRSQFLDETNAGLSRSFPQRAGGSYTVYDLLKENFIPTASVVYRRHLIGTLPDWFLRRQPGDWALNAFVAKSGKIYLMDEVLTVYRIHRDGAWLPRSSAYRLKETIRMMKALKRELGFEYTSTIRETIARCYLEWGLLAQQDGNRVETGKCLINCLLNGGASVPRSHPQLRAFAWHALLGSWHPVLARAKQAILRITNGS